MTAPFFDIFVTALEGGIGYWSEAESYHIWLPDTDEEDTTGFYADIIDVEDDVKYHIDIKVLRKGYGLAASTFRNKIAWSTTPPPLVWTKDTDWDFDAGDADCIVQLGLFGEVVYG
jgi:hypothetical protein